MPSFSYPRFLAELQLLPGFENYGRSKPGFAPKLAFGLFWLSFQWSKRLSAWDLGLRNRSRPWVYAGLFLLLLLAVLWPQWMNSGSDLKPASSLVLSLPLVPIEPTLIPDTLVISSSLNQQYHEK